MVEIDFSLNPKPMLVGSQFAISAVPVDRNRLDHFDIAPRQCARCKAGLIDRANERYGAAIHDRHFRAIDLDNDIVDVEAAQGCQQMFGGRAKRALSVTEHRSEFSCRYGAHVGADLALNRPIRCNALEYDAAVVVSGVKSE